MLSLCHLTLSKKCFFLSDIPMSHTRRGYDERNRLLVTHSTHDSRKLLKTGPGWTHHQMGSADGGLARVPWPSITRVSPHIDSAPPIPKSGAHQQMGLRKRTSNLIPRRGSFRLHFSGCVSRGSSLRSQSRVASRVMGAREAPGIKKGRTPKRVKSQRKTHRRPVLS